MREAGNKLKFNSVGIVDSPLSHGPSKVIPSNLILVVLGRILSLISVVIVALVHS